MSLCQERGGAELMAKALAGAGGKLLPQPQPQRPALRTLVWATARPSVSLSWIVFLRTEAAFGHFILIPEDPRHIPSLTLQLEPLPQKVPRFFLIARASHHLWGATGMDFKMTCWGRGHEPTP